MFGPSSNLALSALRPVSREQVERVRGEWINTNKEVEQMCKCSKCGYPIDEAIEKYLKIKEEDNK